MTDIPIIFSAPMVRGFMEDRKTMTRRLAWRIKDHGQVAPDYPGNPDFGRYEKVSTPWQRVKVGDRLWVRESAHIDCGVVSYMADHPGDPTGLGWRPSIHMPRTASRLTLIVEATKVEPLQSISDADALAEGVESQERGTYGVRGPRGGWLGTTFATAREAFSYLWMALHGAQSWKANPEVVALTLRVIKANIDDVSPPHKTHTGALARPV